MSTLIRSLSKYKAHIVFTIRYFKKYFGLRKTLKQLLLYHYTLLKEPQLDLTKERIVEVNGYKLLLMPNDKGISTELLMFKTHEPLTTQLLLRELKKGMVCIDIGSNIGYYVLLESRVVGDSGKVIAIEPSPKNFNYLRINLVQQKAFNVEPKNFAIGDSNGEIEFLISDRSNYCRVATHGQMEFDTIEKIIKIQAKRLDSFLEENPLEKLDFIRMDVEGYESNIYEGMKNTVSIFRPMLLIEVHKIYLGVEGTKKFLLELKNDGYEINYYIPREMDVPLMGSMKDVQKISIDELIRRLEEDFVSDNFHLFLVNHRR